MGALSLPHLIILALVVILLFGRGRISETMGDFGKGIKSFKQGMNEGAETPLVQPPVQIPQAPAASAQPAAPMSTSAEQTGSGPAA